ncbi:hypothetical protein WJX74_009134 [Apatococcus lobatus]|uniref:SnoaL-like domain-containing protein n=1 Tax=Apatococcus lobatus TaxID=904363 RepID=A0AAW1R311_9CHLO
MALAVVQQAVGSLWGGNLQGLVDCFSEDAVLTMHVNPAIIPHGGEHRGKAGVKHYFELAFSNMDVSKHETLHMISQGDVVISRGWADARCKATNKSGRLHYATTWTVKDGRVICYNEMVDSAMEEDFFTK